MVTRAEHLISELTSNPTAPHSGLQANELLDEFCQGFPLQNLLPLLFSRYDEVAKVGSFIASELGIDATEILDHVVKLLHHRARAVRFGIIDVVLVCATPRNGCYIATVTEMLNDDDAAVRWKVLDFLSRASDEQLRAALKHLQEMEPGSSHVRGLGWLLSDEGQEASRIIALIQSDDLLSRKYGAVAAARMARVFQEPLQDAASSDDSDVRDFAADALKLRQP